MCRHFEVEKGKTNLFIATRFWGERSLFQRFLAKEFFALEIYELDFPSFSLMQILCPDGKGQPHHLHNRNYTLRKPNDWLPRSSQVSRNHSVVRPMTTVAVIAPTGLSAQW